MTKFRSDDSGNAEVAVLSRRDVLAGMGCAGVLAVAGPTLLTASPAKALINAPVMEPQIATAEAVPIRVAEHSAAEEKLADNIEAGAEVEVSARRRRYWRGRGWRRRHWRRRYWRRRYRRLVCRRRWIRGRLVRVCRRVW